MQESEGTMRDEIICLLDDVMKKGDFPLIPEGSPVHPMKRSIRAIRELNMLIRKFQVKLLMDALEEGWEQWFTLNEANLDRLEEALEDYN